MSCEWSRALWGPATPARGLAGHCKALRDSKETPEQKSPLDQELCEVRVHRLWSANPWSPSDLALWGSEIPRLREDSKKCAEL